MADIRLTFDNAMKYNPPENAVHQRARKLQSWFDNKYNEYCNAGPAGPKRGRKRKPDSISSVTSGDDNSSVASGSSDYPSQKRVALVSSSDTPVVVASQPDVVERKVLPAGPTAATVADTRPSVPVTINLEACNRILQPILEHDCAGPFLKPVGAYLCNFWCPGIFHTSL